jgi:hypothetical protein
MGSKLSEAESAYQRGDLDDAEMYAAQAMNDNRNATTLAAFARIVGENGRRPDAAGILVAIVDQFPNDGYLRTLLGEQQVRLGQWGPGTQNFVRGLNAAENTSAMLHAMTVIADLVSAHRSGKVSKQDAMQFINGINYNVARAPQELKQFLATARRAVERGTTVEEAGGRVPPDNILIPGRQGATASNRPPAPPERDGLERRNERMAERRERKQRRSRTNSQVGAGITMQRVGGGTTIAQLMRRDRELNEQIQQTLPPLGLPAWPSDSGVSPLDRIPPMRPTILGFTSDDIRANSNFTFTEGSINAEIVMERAWHALREAAAYGTARPVQLRPADITKLEVALWDGAIDKMRPVPRLFDDEPHYNLAELAVGKYIGDVICKNYGGFWYYERTPEQSFVQIAGERIDPLAVARKWYRSDDKDDVSLEEPIFVAKAVSDQAEMQEAAIDVVVGLDDRALALKLAEHWILFRTHPNDVQLVRVADAITPAERTGDMIVFMIDAAWAPPNSMGRSRLGLDDRGRVAVAYDRLSDEFFLLGSRKHFALFLHKADIVLERDSLQQIADLFDNYHCPAVKCVRSSKDELGPRLEQTPQGANFWLGARGNAGNIRWRITYREQAPIRWRIEVAE